MSKKEHETIILMDYAAVAERTGLEVPILRMYAARGKMPEPDYRISQSPGWLPATINQWVATFTPAGLPPARKRVG
jgi:predicted DNA-binding transcriptional regulator AlpA